MPAATLALWLVACSTPEEAPQAPQERLPTAAELNARPPEAPTPREAVRRYADGDADDWEVARAAMDELGSEAIDRAVRSNALRRRFEQQRTSDGVLAAATASTALSETLEVGVLWGPIVDALRADCAEAACRVDAATWLDTQRQAHPDAWSVAAATFDLSEDAAVRLAALGDLHCHIAGQPEPRRDIELAFEKRRDALGGAVALPECL